MRQLMKNNYQMPDQGAERRRIGEAKRIVFQMDDELHALGAGRTYYIRTYGCQANVRDSETLEGMLGMMGFVPVNSPQEADISIFNTCAVRRAAEEHALGEIGSLKTLKKEHPEKKLFCAAVWRRKRESWKI